jgi:Secretion system C-terminal sorting domain
MKKIYLSTLSLAIVAGATAQVGNAPLAPKNSTFESTQSSVYHANFEKATIWTNDISTASDWTFANTSVPVQNWYIETNPASVPSDGPVLMASASNGYLMIDSDAAGQTATQDAYATYTGTINCTGQPAVTLEWGQHYRTYQDTREIQVSNNGGTSWTTYVITDGTEAGGTVVSGIGSIDISGSAGNQASVIIRFHYVGAWGWHWAVDDLLLKTTEPYDLRADGTFWGVDGSWGPRLPYYSTPSAQVQAINFCGINTNIGLNNIADATYGIAIASGGFTSSGTVNSIVGATDTICASAAFTPSTIPGSHTAIASMTTTNPDTGTSNNSFENITFGVTPFLYARDNAAVVVEGGTFNSGEGFEAGNIFDIFTNADLTRIQVQIHPAAEVGATVYAKLYTIDDATGDFILEDQSLGYTLTAQDLDNTISLPLLTGAFPLTAGMSYLVTAGSDGDGGLTNDLVIAASGNSEAQTTFYYDQTDATWYYSSSTPAVRMDFTPASLDEAGNVFGMGVYPNPANTEANVTFNLNNTADVNITVTDLSGKVVYSNALGNVAAGKSEVALNTAALSNGVYMINVSADNAVSTQKLVVRK